MSDIVKMGIKVSFPFTYGGVAMLGVAVVGCLGLWSSFAEAVKWDFDDGTTQGWSAKSVLIRLGHIGARRLGRLRPYEVARKVAAGVYFYRVEVGERVETKKMTKLP